MVAEPRMQSEADDNYLINWSDFKYDRAVGNGQIPHHRLRSGTDLYTLFKPCIICPECSHRLTHSRIRRKLERSNVIDESCLLEEDKLS